MEIIIENKFLQVRIASLGAELTSIVKKEDGKELLWNADPSVWGRHAPILFPYCGRLKGGAFTHNNVQYEGEGHGFARDMEFACTEQGSDNATFELAANAVTMEKFPFVFRLTICYSLSGNVLTQSVRVGNEGSWDMPFSLGFHPAFMCPFDAQHATGDYELRFSGMETPTKISTGSTDGLVTGEKSVFFENKNSLPLSDTLFANDSICLADLRSDTLSLVEKDSGRSISVGIKGYPYVLAWSMPGEMKFVCIEPWHGLPDTRTASGEWSEKPATAILQEGSSWGTELVMSFDR